jgi:hypothetical protein
LGGWCINRRGGRPGRPPDVRVSDPNDVGGRRRQTRPGRPEGKTSILIHPRRPSQLPKNRCIPAQNTSKAEGQVRPAGADFGTVLITSSILRPNVPWDCCWVRNWQCSTGGHLREGQRAAFQQHTVQVPCQGLLQVCVLRATDHLDHRPTASITPAASLLLYTKGQ